MRRVCTLVGMTVFALAARASVAHATTTGETKSGEVKSLAVVSASGRAEVVIAVDNSVSIQDFSLADPSRVVLDLKGARLDLTNAAVRSRASRRRDQSSRRAVPREHGARGDRPRRRITSTRSPAMPTKSTSRSMPPRSGRSPPGAPHRRSRAPSPPADAAADVAPDMRDGAPDLPQGQRRSGKPEPSSPRRPRSRASPSPTRTPTFATSSPLSPPSPDARSSSARMSPGNVTAEIRDQPWDVALRAILQAQGLAAAEDSTASSPSTATRTSRRQAVVRAAHDAAHPDELRPRLVARPRPIKSLLSKDCPPARAAAPRAAPANCRSRARLVARRHSHEHAAHHRDAVAPAGSARATCRSLDVRTPQVAIKAKIIFVNRTNIEDIGLSTTSAPAATSSSTQLVQRTDPSTRKPIDTNGDGVPDALGGGTPFSTAQHVSSSAATRSPRSPTPTPASSTRRSSLDLLDRARQVPAHQLPRRAPGSPARRCSGGAEHRDARQSQGRDPRRSGNSDSRPRRGRSARAERAASTSPRATVRFKETGIILTVTPHITNNRQILLTLHAENSQLAARSVGRRLHLRQAARRQPAPRRRRRDRRHRRTDCHSGDAVEVRHSAPRRPADHRQAVRRDAHGRGQARPPDPGHAAHRRRRREARRSR